MQFAVIGLGQFGFSLAVHLAGRGGEVIAIDSNPDIVEEIKDRVAQAATLDSTDERALRAVGVQDVDVAVVAIGSTEMSVLTTALLKRLGVERIIARATTELHGQILAEVGAHRVINPEGQMGEQVAKSIVAPGVIEHLTLATGHSLAELVPRQEFIGKTIRELDLRARHGVNIVAIRRGISSEELCRPRISDLPTPDRRIEEGDVLIVVGGDEAIEELGRQKPPTDKPKRQLNLRQDALAIFRAGLRSVIPQEAIRNHVKQANDKLTVGDRSYHLKDFEHVWLVGAGKAGAAMTQAMEETLGRRLDGGVVVVKRGHRTELKRVRLFEAGHPLPDDDGVKGAQEIVKLLTRASQRDLVICLISGGGSALLPWPAEGISLSDKQRTTDLLLKSGATIQEINAIRKHISRVKGGQLARVAAPARLITLILSDVIGDRLDAIASGPTVPDETTYQDCLKIVARYDLQGELPPSILNRLQRGARGELPETPKPEDPIFAKTENLVVGSNLLALRGAERKAQELGYSPLILSSSIEGETREVAKVHAAVALEIRDSKNPIPPPACLLSGGETTVTVTGDGMGGRNQEFVLACAVKIAGENDVVVLSGGTDGTDGPTDAAGAIADGATVTRGSTEGMDARAYLDRNDSYHFFQRLDDLVITGPTQTNVMDLRIFLIG